MSQRYFTPQEANAMVPRLEAALTLMLRLRLELRAVADRLAALGEPLTDESIDREGGSPDVARARGQARALMETLSEEQRALDLMGVEIKDPETGLCDFVALREGREVYLCWRLGEKRVEFWHEMHSGFAGRKPLDASFQRVLH